MGVGVKRELFAIGVTLDVRRRTSALKKTLSLSIVAHGLAALKAPFPLPLIIVNRKIKAYLIEAAAAEVQNRDKMTRLMFFAE